MVLVLLIAASILALLSAFNVPGPKGLKLLDFAIFLVIAAMLVGRLPA